MHVLDTAAQFVRRLSARFAHRGHSLIGALFDAVEAVFHLLHLHVDLHGLGGVCTPRSGAPWASDVPSANGARHCAGDQTWRVAPSTPTQRCTSASDASTVEPSAAHCAAAYASWPNAASLRAISGAMNASSSGSRWRPAACNKACEAP